MFATMMETPLKEAPITPATGIRSNRSSTSPGHLELDYITYIYYYWIFISLDLDCIYHIGIFKSIELDDVFILILDILEQRTRLYITYLY